MKGLSGAVDLLRKSKRVILSAHINPDGDAIGSLLALGLGLRRLKKKVTFLSPDGIPANYRALPGVEHIVRRAAGDYDLAVAVDCSTSEMLGAAAGLFRGIGAVLEIDHHPFRRPFGTACYLDPQAAAVGEMIYRILRRLHVPIDRAIAANIMTSLIVETGSFRLPSLRPETFLLCAQMLKTGIDFFSLTEAVYWSRTRQNALLSGICLSRCRFLLRGRLVWSLVSRADFKKCHGRDEDVDPVADEMRSIDGVEIAILFREKSAAKLRVSLRSKREINVARLAEAYGGGGHYDVAGCVISNTTASINLFVRRAAAMLSSRP
ncbi:MAG: DHHA1 domain-containing protein [Candidatus Omnitrophica bacterium]|nr:DHHA1 domain-containing protein [Candidatus Omnitrophota bacterium]